MLQGLTDELDAMLEFELQTEWETGSLPWSYQYFMERKRVPV